MVYQRNKKAKGDPHFNNNQKGVTGEIRSPARSNRASTVRRAGRSTGGNRLQRRSPRDPVCAGQRAPDRRVERSVRSGGNRAATGEARDAKELRSTIRSDRPPPGCQSGRSTGFVEENAEVASGNGQILKNTINTPSSTLEGVELWEIIVHGYREPQDPIRLTSTEFYNRQLNASARDKIRSGINRKLLDQVNDIESAKELWDRIVVLQEGTDLIQSALYETAKQEAHQFMIREGESMADAYARLGALRVRVNGLGVEKYNDGFEMNEQFIKSKVIAMIAVQQEDTNLALNLQIMTKSADLNSDDLVSYVAANENMAKAGKRLMAMNCVDEASHNHEAPRNLALKARVDHGGEEYYEIEEEEEMTSTSDMATDFAFFAKKYKAKFPMLLNDKKKKRTCYNCDEDSHFANECPYEKRVDKPRFIKGVKPRLKPNPINDRYKKNKGRAFVGAEYLSDDEEEDEEKEAGGREHAKLVEEHVRLQEELSLHVETNAYLESLVTKYGLDYHPNESSCEQASILEENVRLTKELAKFTTAKNKMGLDDLLSKQRSNNQKYGLGYAPKSHKKNNYKKEKPAQDKNKKVTNNGKASKGKATSGDRTGPNDHYALFVDYYGDVYANYVGPPNGYAYREYSIWGYSFGGPKWVFDSGCTNHMTGGKGVLDQFIEDNVKEIELTQSFPLPRLEELKHRPSAATPSAHLPYGVVRRPPPAPTTTPGSASTRSGSTPVLFVIPSGVPTIAASRGEDWESEGSNAWIPSGNGGSIHGRYGFWCQIDETDDEEKNENDDSLVLADYEGEDLPTIEWNRENPQLVEGTVFQMIMSSGTSEVLLNGVPGKKFHCRRGVRQGDPLSPLLFVAVSELLQAMVNQLFRSGVLHAPLNIPNTDFPIVQYADDTLLVMQACPVQLAALKVILEDFAQATGLRVNYAKSALMSINISEEQLASLASSFGCAVGKLPFTYLGLPMGVLRTRPIESSSPSPRKLNVCMNPRSRQLGPTMAPSSRTTLCKSLLMMRASSMSFRRHTPLNKTVLLKGRTGLSLR
ncbi:hypothetical protein QYE76_059924, partial [Lolium multiflorum]